MKFPEADDFHALGIDALMGFGNGFKTSASLSSTGSAAGAKSPAPLGNRMSVLISISSHMFSRLTLTRLASISAFMAS
jgi:hypothetical protein